MEVVVLLAICLGVAFATAMIASTKNGNAMDWGFWSFFFFPVPLIIIVALLPKLPAKSEADREFEAKPRFQQ